MNKASVFVTFGFLSLIFLALTVLWSPMREPVSETVAKPDSASAEVSGSAAGAAAVRSEQPAVSKQPMPAGDGNEPVGESVAASSVAASPVVVAGRELQFLNWPKPAFAIVATGEQRGYFEPCGCTANQLGGMTRRAGLFRRLETLGWTARGVDVGSLSKRTGLQAQLKFETTLEAMRQLKYVALAIGPEELRLDPGFLLAQHLVEGEESLAFLGANLTFFGAKEIGTPLMKKVLTIGDSRVGITSVMSETLRKEVLGTNAGQGDIEWTDPSAALQDVMKQFADEGVTFRILLSQSTIEESRQLARDFPAFDVIVTAQGFGEGEQEPERIGSVRLVQAGEKGKTAAVMGVYPGDTENPVRFELVTLSGDRFGEDPAMVDLMKGYQQRLQEQQVVAVQEVASHPSGASFVGASKCGECHTQAMATWNQTAHAHAFESLDPQHGRPESERLHGILRTHDPECLACHVTGWSPEDYVRFRSGFLNEEYAATDADRGLQSLLAGNQCENCHGPGNRHVELIEAGRTEAAAIEVRVTLQQARETLCVKCHDADNSPEFDFDKYWDAVKHPGKD
jgi:hypothetical protein